MNVQAMLTLQAMEDTIETLRKLGWGPVKLSEALGTTPQAISQWKKVPASRAIDVEKLTGISRHVLRPDIFGEAA